MTMAAIVKMVVGWIGWIVVMVVATGWIALVGLSTIGEAIDMVSISRELLLRALGGL